MSTCTYNKMYHVYNVNTYSSFMSIISQ
jgi:hypothetical protein